MRARVAAVMVVTSVFAWANVAGAGAPTDALREFFAEGSRILTDPAVRDNPAAGLDAARRLIHRAFDVREAAAHVLGREWDARTPDEQTEFVGLFADLMERAYLAQVVARRHGDDGVRVTYVGETLAGDTAIVDTTVAPRAGVTIPFQYRMARTGDRWTVRDVVVDGISFVENYRAQFARVIRRSSYADMITVLRAKSSLALAARPTAASARAAAPPAVATAASSPSAPTPGAPVAPSPAPAAIASARSVATPVVRHVSAPIQTAGHAYWVQIGAFRDASSARRLIERLGALRTAVATAADSLVRVRVGPFLDRADAFSALRELERRGFRSFIVETKDSPPPGR